MTPFESFKLYTAIKNHFTVDSYDYFKYNGKVRVTEISFETRKDKYMFYKLSKHEDPLTFLVSIFSNKNKVWVGNMFDLEYQLVYNEFLRRKQSLSYMFETKC